MQEIIVDKLFYILGGLILALTTYFLGKKERTINNRKEEAVANQEEIKAKKSELELAVGYQEYYKNTIKNISDRIADLEKKYGEILLRNSILEERAETREKQYKILQGEYSILSEKYEKLHKENISIKKEIEKLKLKP